MACGSNFSKDSKGEKLTDQIPHYIKEESIGFSTYPDPNTDLITSFLDKYCEKDRYAETRKSLSKNFILSKTKVKPEVNIVPRAKKTHLSLREKRQLGLYKISRTGLMYQQFVKLNELWKQYMLDSLDFNHFANKTGTSASWEQLASQLYRADYHGALVTVVRSKCPSHVGLHGIVVMDTKNTFRIIAKDNIVRTVPKQSSVFQLQVDQFQLTVYGHHMCIRPADRSTKKIRSNLMPDL